LSTLSFSVSNAPIETLAIHLPSSIDGVSQALPDSLMLLTQVRVCSSNSFSSMPSGSWRTQIVCNGTGASTFQFGSCSTSSFKYCAFARSRRSLFLIDSAPSDFSRNHIFNALKPLPSGMLQCHQKKLEDWLKYNLKFKHLK